MSILVLVYLTRSSIAAKLHVLISDECNGKGVEGSVHGLIYLEGFRNTMRDLNEDTWSVA